MERYISAAQRQFIDSNGKCRVLIYVRGGGEISLFTRPLAPSNNLTIATFITRKPPGVAKLPVILDFCNEMGLKLVKVHRLGGLSGLSGAKEGASERSETAPEYVGLTVTDPSVPLLRRAYIAIRSSDPPPGIPITSDSGDPLLTSTSSPIDHFRKTRRVADIIMAYVLWTYSRALQGLGPFEDGWEDEESFVIEPTDDLDYYSDEISALGSRLYYDGNDSIYSKGKIRVTSREMMIRLLAWLKVQIVRNPGLVASYWENKTIPDYYKTISDFRTSEKQLIFVNRTGLGSWIQNRALATSHRNRVLTSLDLGSVDPYFYFWGGVVYMIQNVEGGVRESAAEVVRYWVAHRRNLGWGVKVGEGGGAGVDEVDEVSLTGVGPKGSAIARTQGTYFAVLDVAKSVKKVVGFD